MSKQDENSDSGNAVSEIKEKEVVFYLDKHPDLLISHPDLLERLQIPHNTGPGMVSLIERQVEVLREKNRLQEERLLALIRNAQQNEEITEKLHRYSLQHPHSQRKHGQHFLTHWVKNRAVAIIHSMMNYWCHCLATMRLPLIPVPCWHWIHHIGLV